MPMPFSSIINPILNKITIKTIIIVKDKYILDSSNPKNPYLNTLTIYAIGLNSETSCQISGSDSIE